jgi:hypothetical protein
MKILLTISQEKVGRTSSKLESIVVDHLGIQKITTTS